MHFGETRDDTAGSRPGRGGSVLDLQSLIDRLFIDLV